MMTDDTFNRRAILTLRWHIFSCSGLIVLLLFLALSSLFVGARSISVGETIQAFWAYEPTNDAHIIIRELRLPRTIVTIVAGLGLGGAGIIMQTLTRNPLAEPGLLGVNAGAALGVIIGIALFQVSAMIDYVWFSFIGAGLAGLLLVLVRGQFGRHDPLYLVLSGLGLTIVLTSITNLIMINAPLAVFDQLRNWLSGSGEGRGFDVAAITILFVFIGLVLAFFNAANLNILSLGKEISVGLGVNLRKTEMGAILSVMILAGAATAAIGPVSFIGLIAPHLARLAFGSNMRWLLPCSACFAAIVLLLADMIGRVIAPPSEVQAGIIAMFIGGAFFIAVIRRFRFF